MLVGVRMAREPVLRALRVGDETGAQASMELNPEKARMALSENSKTTFVHYAMRIRIRWRRIPGYTGGMA